MKSLRPRHPRWAALLLATSLAGTAAAQTTAAPPRSPEVQQRIAQAKQRLHLTAEQESRLRALLQEEAGKLRAIRDKYTNDTSLQGRGARSREVRAVHDEFRTRLQGVLSPAQLDEWDKMAAERRAEARQRPPP